MTYRATDNDLPEVFFTGKLPKPVRLDSDDSAKESGAWQNQLHTDTAIVSGDLPAGRVRCPFCFEGVDAEVVLLADHFVLMRCAPLPWTGGFERDAATILAANHLAFNVKVPERLPDCGSASEPRSGEPLFITKRITGPGAGIGGGEIHAPPTTDTTMGITVATPVKDAVETVDLLNAKCFQIRLERDPGNPIMRIVFVNGCSHRVSLADGQGTPAGNFVEFAKAEHRLFCFKGSNSGLADKGSI